MTTAADRYRTRLRKVLEYIDAHLHEDLDVERLSNVAAFSKFHFHRQFTGSVGIGVYRYIQLKRFKRASWQLAFRKDIPVLEIALASGYEGPEAFSRAFRKTLGQAPSDFRKAPQWNPWYAVFEPMGALRSVHMTTDYGAEQVQIVQFDETRLATLEHRGDPKRLGDSIRRFIEWRRQNGLSPRVSATFNLLYDDPAVTATEDFRMDLCAATDREIAENACGIVVKTIPAGRCAVLRHVGSDDNLDAAVTYLYSQWLPQSGEELRDFPLFFQRVSFFPDVPEHEAVTDIFLPLR